MLRLLQSRPARPATQPPPIRLRRRRPRSTRDPPRRRRVADSTTTTTTNPTVRPLPRRIPLRAAAARATDRDRARILPTDRVRPRLLRRKTRLATPLGRNPTPSRRLLAGGLINKQATHPRVCRLFVDEERKSGATARNPPAGGRSRNCRRAPFSLSACCGHRPNRRRRPDC